MQRISRVFFGVNTDVVDYRHMTWRVASCFLIAETTSLGVLGLPNAVKQLGLVPGLLFLNTTYPLLWYTGYLIYSYVMRDPNVRSFADAFEVLFSARWKPWARRVAVTSLVLYLLFVMAAHMIGFDNMLRRFFGEPRFIFEYKLFAMLAYLAFTIPRKLNSVMVFYIVSTISIFSAAIVAVVAVGRSPVDFQHFLVTPLEFTSIAQGSEGVSTIIVASMAHIAYPTVISEMKEPRDFPKALAVQQISTLVLANMVCIVFYLKAGQDVASPALGSALGNLGKIAYGLAGPSIIIAGFIAAAIAAKEVFYQLWKSVSHVEVVDEGSARARLSWAGVNATLCGSALGIAIGIPIFEHLYSLMGALFGTFFALMVPTGFWFGTRMNQNLPAHEEHARARTIYEEANHLESVLRISNSSEQPSSNAIEVDKIECIVSSAAVDCASKTEAASTDHSETTVWKWRSLPGVIKRSPVLSGLDLLILILGIAQFCIGTYASIVGIIKT